MDQQQQQHQTHFGDKEDRVEENDGLLKTLPSTLVDTVAFLVQQQQQLQLDAENFGQNFSVASSEPPAKRRRKPEGNFETR